MQGRWSFITWILLCYALLRIAYLQPIWRNHGAFTWDAFSFYIYLPATFIYHDVERLNWLDTAVFRKYPVPVSGFASAVPDGSGRHIFKSSMGLAVMQAPFFALAHLLAPRLGYPADGFSMPYQYIVSLGLIFYAWLGLWWTRKILLRYFSDGATAMAMGLLVLGSNYLHYAAFKNAEAHSTLFMLYALLIWLTLRWHEQPARWRAAAMGLVAGMIVLVRPTDVVCVIIPLCWYGAAAPSLKAKFQLLLARRGDVLALIVAAAAVGIWQLLYWKLHSGHWLYYSYDDQGFDFLSPNLINGIFSWHKGWLIYTPLMLFALAGFVPLFRRYPGIAWALLAYIAVNLYVVFSWKIWHYGGGLGARPLVQSYAALMLPLAAFTAWLLQQRVWLQGLMVLLLLLCVDHNLMLLWHSNAPNGGMVTEQMNRAYLLHLVGNTHVKPDDKQLLDAPRVLRDTSGYTREVLYFNDYEADTTAHRSEQYARSGRYACLLDTGSRTTPRWRVPADSLRLRPGDWFRLQADVYFEYKEWNMWNQAHFMSTFYRQDKPYEFHAVRVHWLTPERQWYRLSYDKRVTSKLRPGDEFEATFILAQDGTHPVWVDNLQVVLFRKKR